MFHLLNKTILLCYLIMNGLSFGDEVPCDTDPLALDIALQAAGEGVDDLKTDVEIMAQSMDTYIPVHDPDDRIFDYSPFIPDGLFINSIEAYIEEDDPNFDPFSTTSGILPKRYDCLFVISDTTNKNYHLVWLNEQQLHLHELRHTKRNIYEEKKYCVELTQEHAEELIGLMKQYKASNAIGQKISDRDHLPLIYRLFGSYAEDQKNEYIFYGVDSKIFGVVFGDGFIPKNTISWYMHSFLQSMFHYFDQSPGDQEEAKMALAYNAFLHQEVRKIQLKIKELESTRPPLPQARHGDRPAPTESCPVQGTQEQGKNKQ